MTLVLIDTDPGTDDAIALMMALNAPDIDVVGITTVGGNATLSHTTRNALCLLEYLGASDVGVYPGSDRPLNGEFTNAYQVHGAEGLGVSLPEPASNPNIIPAPRFIAESASNHRGDLIVIALGPLTNIARAIKTEPRLQEWVKELVVMGGAIEVPGNVTSHAEFNIYNDVLAADLVLSSGIPVTLVGLDVTMQTNVARNDELWPKGDAATARLSRCILANWFRSNPDLDKYYLHDPLAIVAMLQPTLFTFIRAEVSVGISFPETFGKIIAAYGRGSVKIAVKVDVAGSKERIRHLLELQG